VTLEGFLEQVGEKFYADTHNPCSYTVLSYPYKHTHAIDLGYDI
jgi:hypothetical protein